MAKDLLFLSECFMCIWEECVFCCSWVKDPINVRYVTLADNVVLVIYSLNYFLLTSNNYWNESVKVSKCSYGLSLSSFTAINVCLICFETLLSSANRFSTCTDSLKIALFIIMRCLFLSLVIFLSSSLLCLKLATPLFLASICVVYFSISFRLFLYLKWIFIDNILTMLWSWLF